MNGQKVLIFEAYPFFSGSQRITLNVCKVLKKKGCYITLLLADDRYGNLRKNFEQYVDQIKHIKTNESLLKYGDEDSWFSKKTFLKSVIFGLLPFYLKSLKMINSKQYDVLYCCDPRGATMMLVSALFFKKTTILHFHGKNRLSLSLSKVFLKVFDKVICVSQDVADSLPVSLKKTVIYNGIDFSQYEQLDTTEVIKEVEYLTGGVPYGTPIFLYAGLLRPHKGVHHLIEAFNQLVKNEIIKTKPILFLCGAAKTQSEESYRDFLIKYCFEHGLEKNIYWVGWKNNVLAWMQYSDYFVFPTIKKENNNFEGFGRVIESTEGLPTVLIEASLCNIYIIASEVTGVNEIISDGHNGSVYEYTDGNELYKSLLDSLVNDRQFMDFPNFSNFELTTFEKHLISIFK
jgi:glycosyltransferase involved in cell wall biosynthesis